MMANKNKRVDEYIKKAQPFAQPILKHLRALVHEVCPEVEETIKWSFPCFDYKGPFCHMASFKEHAVFGFWKAALMTDKKLLTTAKSEVAMGHLGKITSLKDLPSDKIMKAYIKEAMILNENNIKLPVKPKVVANQKIETPGYLISALKKNKKAEETYDAFSYSNKKEYVTWLEEAKTEATKNKRLADAITWMAEGKIRNWKYLKK
ncbi:MAG: DUF1801 domain-containing protein [Bacteroidota bacterium]